jgi:hypothetical protein
MTEIPEVLRDDWQKVADATGLPVHVFRNVRWQFMAVTNKTHGAGEWLATIMPDAVSVNADAAATHGLGAVAWRKSHGDAAT